MTHGTLHIFYVERMVAVHHPFDILVPRSEPLDANAVNSAIGDGFTHLLERSAGEGLFHVVVVWIMTLPQDC